MPASFFGMAVGTLALANAWQVAARLWPIPALLAHAVTGLGLGIWLLLLVAYARKWVGRRALAREELRHPLQSSFVALGPVSSMLAAMAVLPWSRPLAVTLFVAAMLAQFALSLWLYGAFWQGGRPAELVTTAAYFPAVAQNLVAGAAAAAFGWPELGMWFFGAGMFAWLAIESLVLGRAANLAPMPEPLRPLLGVQLAPPVVAGVSYMSLTSGVPDLFAHALLGYGLYQAALLLRLLPWVCRQPFTPAYWAFSFGVAAAPALALRMLERGAGGPLPWLAPALFIASNGVIALLLVKTALLWFSGRLLPAAPAPSPAPPAPAPAT